MSRLPLTTRPGPWSNELQRPISRKCSFLAFSRKNNSPITSPLPEQKPEKLRRENTFPLTGVPMRRGRFRADDAGPLNEPVHLPSVLVTTVLEHLEAGGVPQNVCDQVVKIIEKWEL